MAYEADKSVDPLQRHIQNFLDAVRTDPNIASFLKDGGAAGGATLSDSQAAFHARCLIEYRLCRLGVDSDFCRVVYESSMAKNR